MAAKIFLQNVWTDICSLTMKMFQNGEWQDVKKTDKIRIGSSWIEICPDPVVPCGSGASYTGGESYPSTYEINLGTDLGYVGINYDANQVPDKFILEFDGVVVYDSGYRGQALYQQELDDNLALRGLPSEPIVGTGAGTGGFNKTTATTKAFLKVYAPIPGTAWDALVLCPGASFGNERQVRSVSKSDCPSGSTGTSVDYVVPANKYQGASVAAANAQAISEIDAEGYIYGNENGICINNAQTTTMFVDIDGDTSADLCFYIDTPGVTESGTVLFSNHVSQINNFFPVGATARGALLLASDLINNPTTKWRQAAGLGALAALYPDMDPVTGIPKFIYKLRGRASGARGINGTFSKKFANQYMTMLGSEGSYIPSISPAGGPVPQAWGGSIVGGADGTSGPTIGEVIKTFVYDRASDTLTVE